jgi:ATP-dependent DNA helicase DinG
MRLNRAVMRNIAKGPAIEPGNWVNRVKALNPSNHAYFDTRNTKLTNRFRAFGQIMNNLAIERTLEQVFMLIDRACALVGRAHHYQTAERQLVGMAGKNPAQHEPAHRVANAMNFLIAFQLRQAPFQSRELIEHPAPKGIIAPIGGGIARRAKSTGLPPHGQRRIGKAVQQDDNFFRRGHSKRDSAVALNYLYVLVMSDTVLFSEADELCALVAAPTGALLLSSDGEVLPAKNLTERPLLVCHARLTAQRLNLKSLEALDLLELFAFVRPGKFCVPTPKGLAGALGLDGPSSAEAEALALWQAQTILLDDLRDLPREQAHSAAAIASQMQRGGWRWSGLVLQALGHPPVEGETLKALGAWQGLPEWNENLNRERKAADVSSHDAREKLAALLRQAGHKEARPEQSDFASAVSAAFAEPGETVLAEAGTGVGKTLGYLAPALLWAQSANAPVWLSTYTRNLQRQIEQETARLFPDATERAQRVVIRKGRENYLCLLNYEEAVRQSFAYPQYLIPLGLIARWIALTQDGDIRGGDLPGWLPDLLGRTRILSLADRRGECLHGGCVHYKKCFIERSVRAARNADLVIANHALVMSAAASGGIDEACPPERFVFDEGHHIFHAADSAFGSDLTGQTGYDLRRWLLGGEGRSKGRVRGLFKRAEPLLPNADAGAKLLDRIKQQALCLPGEGWRDRIEASEPRGKAEQLLLAIKQHVLAHDKDAEGPYSLECSTAEVSSEVIGLADAVRAELRELHESIKQLIRLFERRLTQEVELEADMRRRIEALLRTLTFYVGDQLTAWRNMLEQLSNETPPEFVDWLGIDRIDSQLIDVGLYRRWLDPGKPFAETISRQAKGMVLTSATLTDPGADAETSWQAAEDECGTVHLARPAIRARVPSPFNYSRQTRVLVVTDVPMKDEVAVAAAYRELFLAAGGGALGLFTSIERLKRTGASLRAPLAQAGLPLYSQHTDGLDAHTLIDIFRAEGNACLLGTDAVRDGVDVPGRALRLLVFDKIPWPRTNLLLAARKAAHNGTDYTERLTRQKLRQAFGRLIRRADDHGVFVLLSPLPSKLASAFPGVRPERVTLQEAAQITRNFLNPVDSPNTSGL